MSVSKPEGGALGDPQAQVSCIIRRYLTGIQHTESDTRQRHLKLRHAIHGTDTAVVLLALLNLHTASFRLNDRSCRIYCRTTGKCSTFEVSVVHDRTSRKYAKSRTFHGFFYTAITLSRVTSDLPLSWIPTLAFVGSDTSRMVAFVFIQQHRIHQTLSHIHTLTALLSKATHCNHNRITSRSTSGLHLRTIA
jgi:hypothetical protein